MRSAPFFEPDPLERVSGPSSAGNRPQTCQNHNNNYNFYLCSLSFGPFGIIFLLLLVRTRKWMAYGANFGCVLHHLLSQTRWGGSRGLIFLENLGPNKHEIVDVFVVCFLCVCFVCFFVCLFCVFVLCVCFVCFFVFCFCVLFLCVCFSGV